MVFYAVIDTNLLVSSLLKRDSIPAKILDLVISGIIVPLFNEEILEEYAEVLSRKEFGFSVEDIGKLLNFIVQNGLLLEKTAVWETLPDPDDAVFYEIVMSARKNRDAYLVTGNIRHFPTKNFVVTPREMLEIVLNCIDK
ncbi:putative toxin-antitoxin system toxin component, PIN family [bacterium]|nr:putative toxin-antitoxin system toxin component, PIN family [bacterium]MBR0317379.1 putative toxin-antitoxin system toxin component, PIN family [Synergistaceae bacterium]MBR4530834.1 putative toxin-antitoxin system toxin component, PIN family [bacterium]